MCLGTEETNCCRFEGKLFSHSCLIAAQQSWAFILHSAAGFQWVTSLGFRKAGLKVSVLGVFY